jgi:hypothetical protein
LTVGFPPIVTFAAQLPRSVNAPVDQIVRNAVARLLRIQSWFYAAIDTKSYPPCWRMNSDLTVEDILRVRSSDAGLEQLLLDGLHAGKALDISKGPLWQVDVVHHSDGGVTLVLAVHHLLADGVGVRNTFAELLSELSSSARVTSDTMPIPPALEVTMDIRPSWYQLIREFGKAVILPMLPSFLKPAPVVVWPGPVQPIPTPHVKLMELPVDVVADIKRVAREHGVSTLHPVLHASALAALARTFLNEGDTGKYIITDTPISLRDTSLGHPTITGNYVGDFTHTYTHPYQQSFWDLARGFAKDQSDPVIRSEANAAIGMLGYLPDFPPAQVAKSGVRAGETGWEKYLRERFEAKCPFSASLELSNLGLLAVPGGENILLAPDLRVVWAQTPSAIGASICLNVRHLLCLMKENF